MGVRPRFGTADFRRLEAATSEEFDVVLSCDNSIPHLLTQADLETATQSIFQRVKSGGIFVASIRDYDLIIKERPSGMLPRKFTDGEQERIYFQTWDWQDDGSGYALELFLMQKGSDDWQKPLSFKTSYRALLRADFDNALMKAGFESPKWLLGEENPYYQPVVVARKTRFS